MIETVFLFFLAFAWITFAVVQDIRTREIADWLNFSLIVFALGFRFFYSLFSQQGFNFFYQGLFGLLIFLVLGNLFYYGKMFAGGDAKLMIALGAVLPLSQSFFSNIKFLAGTLFIFLLVGTLYSLEEILRLSIKNLSKVRKEFSRQFKIYRKIKLFFLLLAIIVAIVALITNEWMIIYLGVIVFLFPYLYIYVKAVDESCMIKKTKTSELTEGDWLYKDVRIGGKVIKSTWDGLTREQIKHLKKNHKFVLIRHGIPFSPAFWFTALALIFWDIILFQFFSKFF